jgi:glycosyltransferase involved in cell wall biosynthesis
MNAVYSGKPNVVTIHGNMAELNRLGETFKSARLYGILASRLETHSLGRTGGVFCNSAYTESLVAPRAKRTWRVPNAIRGEFFRPRNRQTGSPEVPMILNVGVLGMRKRQLEILRMAAELHTEGYRFQLVFTGAFSTAQEYGQTFASELRKAEKAGYATHAGYLNADSLISLMDEASGFVHFPSEEAFGLVVAEAMARGLKFLGANLGGIKEIATGIPGAELHLSFEELKRGMAAWLDDGAQRVPDAATTIRDKYSPEAVARQHIEIYHDLLNR